MAIKLVLSLKCFWRYLVFFPKGKFKHVLLYLHPLALLQADEYDDEGGKEEPENLPESLHEMAVSAPEGDSDQPAAEAPAAEEPPSDTKQQAEQPAQQDVEMEDAVENAASSKERKAGSSKQTPPAQINFLTHRHITIFIVFYSILPIFICIYLYFIYLLYYI